MMAYNGKKHNKIVAEDLDLSADTIFTNCELLNNQLIINFFI